MPTLRQLRKRKIVQWALAYGAATWVLLQVLGFVVDSYDWPHTISRMGLVIVVIGFLVTMVLAWYHGELGKQEISRKEVLLILGLLALGGGLLWRTAHAPPSSSATVASAPLLVPIPKIDQDPSIAVLPLVNMSEDKGNEYFSDGISEELLNLLAKVPKLRVIARTSSFSFKGKDVAIAEIARALNVAAILEGSVRKSGNTVRITVQLIRASDSSHLWSETYDRTLDDIFKVQDEIAATVVAKLRITLLGAAPTARATDPKAYALYLEATQLARQKTDEAFAKSDGLYRQVLAIDPRYAPAWIGLANNVISEMGLGILSGNEGYADARAAATKALEIDPDNASAHVALGRIALYQGDMSTAARQFEQALAIDPTDLNTLGGAALLFQTIGRLDQSLALDQVVVRRDPVSVHALYNLGTDQVWTGRYDESIASFRTVLNLSPERSGTHATIGQVMMMKGDARGGLAETEKETSELWKMVSLTMIYHALGRNADSDKTLSELIEKYEKEAPYNIAYIYAFRGEADEAFEWLDKSVEYGDPGLSELVTENLFDKIHSDPRWLPFLRKNGKDPETLAKIQFRVSLPN